MEAAGLWRVMLLLLLVLRPSGTASNPARYPPPHRVNSIRGGSVSLPVLISPSKRVAKIEWKFQPPTGLALVIAEFKNGRLERPNPGNRFGQRLEKAGEATLRIVELELGDRGTYVARVRLASAVVEEHSFSCVVYGPVPEPQICHQVTSQRVEGCNVTLQCLASEKGPFNVSWKKGNQLSALEGGLDRYRLSAEGTELHLSWRPDSTFSTITCLLSNPADQKNASFDLLSICPRASRCLSWLRVAMLAGLVVQILAVASVNILARTGQRRDRRAAGTTAGTRHQRWNLQSKDASRAP